MNIEVNGAMLGSFVQACINHKILLESDLSKIITLDSPDKQVMKWYPLEKYEKLCGAVANVYSDPVPIFEKVGEEMMKLWYEFGPGKSLVKSSADFLNFQTGSNGYYSMVKGNKDDIGEFKLEYMNQSDGIAIIKSTTPLNKDVEVGVIRGGVGLFKETNFKKASKSETEKYIFVEFH